MALGLCMIICAMSHANLWTGSLRSQHCGVHYFNVQYFTRTSPWDNEDGDSHVCRPAFGITKAGMTVVKSHHLTHQRDDMTTPSTESHVLSCEPQDSLQGHPSTSY